MRGAIGGRYAVDTIEGEAGVAPEVLLARKRPAVSRILRDAAKPIKVKVNLVLKCLFSKVVLLEGKSRRLGSTPHFSSKELVVDDSTDIDRLLKKMEGKFLRCSTPTKITVPVRARRPAGR